MSDPRLAEAVGRFLEREREDASETIDWYTDHTAFRRD